MVTPYRPADAVLVLAELQPQIVRSSRTNPEATLRRAVSVLTDAAGMLDIPVFASVVPLETGAAPELIEELEGQAPLARSTVSVLDDEKARDRIARCGRKLMAVGGVSSEIAILHTVLGAVRSGYDVHVLVDCCGGLSERTEGAAFRQMEAAGATMSSVSSFLASLTPNLGSPEGQAVFSSLARLWSWNASPGT